MKEKKKSFLFVVHIKTRITFLYFLLQQQQQPSCWEKETDFYVQNSLVNSKKKNIGKKKKQ
jgi:hypothetical protein